MLKQLLELPPLPALRNFCYEGLYATFKHFNCIQTHVFTVSYNTNDNVLVITSTNNEETICTKFASLWDLQKGPKSTMRALYIALIKALQNSSRIEESMYNMYNM